SSETRPSSSQGSRRGSTAGGAVPGAAPVPRRGKEEVVKGADALCPKGLDSCFLGVVTLPVAKEPIDMAHKVLQDLQVRLAQMQSQSQSFDQLAS
ncbi:unnamed protein product, partial [Symbiodinium sp. KB8]